MKTILPCPFCGSKKIVLHYGEYITTCICQNCMAQGPSFHTEKYGFSKSLKQKDCRKAKESWNNQKEIKLLQRDNDYLYAEIKQVLSKFDVQYAERINKAISDLQTGIAKGRIIFGHNGEITGITIIGEPK